MKPVIEEFFKLLKLGYNSTKACNELGLDPKSVHYYMRKYNQYPINKFSKYNIHGDYFDVIDTECKAYFLGLILADGCISLETKKIKFKDKKSEGNGTGYRISIGLQEEDGYLIDKLSKEIGIFKERKTTNCQIGAKFRKPCVKLRFSSKMMATILMDKYNIKPRKTLDTTFEFPFETIPEHLQRHFIRGFFDGDGSISFYLTKKTFFFNFSFVFTSLPFTKQIAKIFQDKFEIMPKIYETNGKTVNWFALRFDYSRNRISKIEDIFKWLYDDSSIFMLRKKKKFEEYFKYRGK